MTFLLPALTSFVIFGQTFDLRNYNLMPSSIIYNNSNISQYLEVANISSFKSEFFVVDTASEFRKALGIDVVTGLKTAINNFPYLFREHLDYRWSNRNEVKILVRSSIRTVKESLPYNVPTVGEWKIKGPELVGSHYVKGVEYGIDSFAILSISGKTQEDKNNIRNMILSKLGKAGIFDLSFKENFNAVIREYKAEYDVYTFETPPLDTSALQLNVEDVLNVKDNLQQLLRTPNGKKPFSIFYEMQSISFLDNRFPLVGINGEISKILEEVEMLYEDVHTAFEEYLSWINENNFNIQLLTPEQEVQIEEFDLATENARAAIRAAISDLDITTTTGNINQFEDAFNAYGDRSSKRKYRDWLTRIKGSN